MAPEEKIGKVTHYYPKAHAAVVHVERGAIHVGDRLHIAGHGDDFRFTVKSLQIDHRPVPEAEAGALVGLAVPKRAHEKADVYLVREGKAAGFTGWLKRILGR
ncbi:MAG: EF-Tu/IF-2/RF-3 family GTPase [Methanobacteriota archaeon]